jgi:hypothetical protein
MDHAICQLGEDVTKKMKDRSHIYSSTEANVKRTNETIPKKKMKWITIEIRQKIREMRKAERTYKKQPSTDNLLIYKLVKAERRRMKRTRKKMWEEFVGTINEKTPSKPV